MSDDFRTRQEMRDEIKKLKEEKKAIEENWGKILDSRYDKMKNLKQTLVNLKRIVETRDTYTNDNSWYQTLLKMVKVNP